MVSFPTVSPSTTFIKTNIKNNSKKQINKNSFQLDVRYHSEDVIREPHNNK